uniref:Uncharacterized protein n=1 Tax=Lactuca sativa TaxID=4236 RepID=A0A9R1WD33_LACSA|nr:hypothetical protein LSAT_V11C200058370 [Lactuca sativa]
MEDTLSLVVIVITVDAGDVDTAAPMEVLSGGTKQANVANNEEHIPFTKRKRKMTSEVLEHFHDVKLEDGTGMCKCIHWKEKIINLKKELPHRCLGML